MIRYRAAWVVPINKPPMRDGWVVVDSGRIAGCGASEQVVPGAPGGGARDADLGNVAILPGLVNTHTHLELSYLRNEVPPAREFVTWIRSLLAARRPPADSGSPAVLDAVDRAIGELVASGTAVVGDIANTLVSFVPLTRSPLAGVVFHEIVRFKVSDPASVVAEACRTIDALERSDRVRASLAAHAPYSVAPLLFREIRRATDGAAFQPCSVHLAESAEETEFIRTGRGPWRQLLEELRVWDPAWVAPGVGPVQFLVDNGFLDARVLVVHGVHLTPSDLDELAARGATLVTCPRSNRHTGAGRPPIEDFYASGVRVAVGTDSLASAPDLSVFAELAALRALAPGVPASRLLSSATYEGARALGFDAEYGTIEPGKSARLLAVDVPPEIADVEEYLVSGICPEQVRWIEC